MCGICGIFDPSGNVAPVTLMNDLQSHRGPDDEGFLFVNTKTGRLKEAGGPATPPELGLHPYFPTSGDTFDMALGSRRLAILDLSPAGHMPMSRDGGNLWIVFNGEVYNYREIRQDLQSRGHRFVSECDTEVVLAAYQEWGADCLRRFNGMFAFAIWDARRQELFCARDRFGVKPFYYYSGQGLFVFASELKSILAHPSVPRVPNNSVIYNYLVLGQSDHAPETFFEDIVPLPAAHFLLFNASSKKLSLRRWWSLPVNSALESGDDDAGVLKGFRAGLEDAIRLRLRSDVPVGSCLSGGLDSSSVVTLASQMLGDNSAGQKTFTARNVEAEIDEFHYSRQIVERTHAEQFTIFPTGERLWDEIRSFVWHMDEPVDSTSQYPQWNVMRLAREQGVTVLLDGQGGDEILGGYYSYWPHYLSQLRREKGTAAYLQGVWDIARVGGRPAMEVLYQHETANMPWRLQQFVRSIRPLRASPGQGGSGLQEHQIQPEFQNQFRDRRWSPRTSDERGLAGILHEDTVSVNLPKLLRYEDRSSMAFSLETRLPFLDYRLVESVFALPLNYRIRGGWNKWILRQSMSETLPPEIAWRRSKLGFPVPEQAWLASGAAFIREQLSGPAAEHLAPYVNLDTVRAAAKQGDAALAATPGLWRILNLAIWFQVCAGPERGNSNHQQKLARATATVCH